MDFSGIIMPIEQFTIQNEYYVSLCLLVLRKNLKRVERLEGREEKKMDAKSKFQRKKNNAKEQGFDVSKAESKEETEIEKEEEESGGAEESQKQKRIGERAEKQRMVLEDVESILENMIRLSSSLV